MNLRRLFCFLLTALFAFQLTFAVEPNIDSLDCKAGKLGILPLLGIVENSDFDSAKINDEIKRGQFLMYLTNAINYQNISNIKFEQVYFDVDKTNQYFPYICLMKNLKVINGDGNSMFYPNSPILLKDALTIAVKLLGYDYHASSKGGYPSGYLLIASNIGLTKGISIKADEPLKKGDLLNLLFNFINTKTMEQVTFGNKDNVNIKENETILESVYQVYEDDGIIEANEYTGLSDSNDSVSEGHVKINNTLFYAEKTDCAENLGVNIRFYYKDDVKNTGRYEIIWYEEKYENSVINLNSSLIDDVKDYVIKYTESIKSKDLKFTGNADIIYNGKAYPEYQLSDLVPKMGNITLVDNDNDKIYDVIRVTSYEDYVVSGLSVAEQKIFLEENPEINLSDSNKIFKIYKNDKRINLEDIMISNILTVAESKDETLYEIYVGEAAVNGTVESIEVDKRTYITIDKTVYPLSEYSLYVPKIGESGIFYLNYFGEISNKDIFTTDEKYGYLIKIGSYGSFEKEYKFKIMTNRGIVVFEPAKKIRINGKDQKDPEIAVLDPDLWVNGATKENGEISEQQLIKYKTNTQGKITDINTYENRTSTVSRKDKNDNAFTFDYISPTEGLYYRGGNARIFGGKYLVNAGTAIFTAPQEYSDDDKDFKSYNISFLKNDRQYKNIEFYDLSYENVTGAIVLRSLSGSAAKIINYDPAILVKRVTNYYTDKECYKIYGYSEGKELEFIVEDLDLADNDEAYGNGITIKDIGIGDVLQLSYDDNRIVDEMRVIFKYSPGFPMKESISAGVHYMHMGLYSACGKIITRSSNVITVNCQNENEPLWDRSFYITSYTHIYQVDTVNKKVNEISPYDIEEGAIVYIRSSYSVLFEIVVYK